GARPRTARRTCRARAGGTNCSTTARASRGCTSAAGAVLFRTRSAAAEGPRALLPAGRPAPGRRPPRPHRAGAGGRAGDVAIVAWDRSRYSYRIIGATIGRQVVLVPVLVLVVPRAGLRVVEAQVVQAGVVGQGLHQLLDGHEQLTPEGRGPARGHAPRNV